MDLFARIANNDLTAIDELRYATAESIILKADIDLNKFGLDMNTLLGYIHDVSNENIEIGASLDNTPFFNALNDMLAQSPEMVDTINALLQGIGYTPKIEYVDVPIEGMQKATDGATYTFEYVDPFTQKPKTGSISADTYSAIETGGVFRMPVINGEKTVFTGSGNDFTPRDYKPTSPGGGGSSNSKSSAPKNVSARYHDTLNRREKTKNSFDKAQAEKEDLWGQARIDKWKEAQKALEDYIKA